MGENSFKHYPSNEMGKRMFTEEVILPLVVNEGHFAYAEYENTDRGEYIMLYLRKSTPAVFGIDITADSIETMARDFMRQFIECVEKVVAEKEYYKNFNW